MVLTEFAKDPKRQSVFQLVWNPTDIGFPLFDDVWKYNLSQFIFHLWGVSTKTLNLVPSLREELTRLLPQNSWRKDIQMYWFMELSRGDLNEMDEDLLSKIIEAYIEAIYSKWLLYEESKLFGLIISANNIPSNIYEDLQTHTVAWLLHRVLGKWLPDSMEMNCWKNYFKKDQDMLVTDSLSIIQDKDGTNFTLDFRGMRAKQIPEKKFPQIVDEIKNDDVFYVSVFPDGIMVYHSTHTINQRGLWFSYEEFFYLLNRVSEKRFRWKRKTLQQAVNDSLRQRVKDLPTP